ncbi:MAG: hypothetical protein ACI80W_000854, partial [Porticoccaceae bacterium]
MTHHITSQQPIARLSDGVAPWEKQWYWGAFSRNYSVELDGGQKAI